MCPKSGCRKSGALITLAALRALGSQALGGFPGTLVPNRLVREFATLGREAGAKLPWVEELAADIFTGQFTAKFLQAAQNAGHLLADTLYADYYGIDYDYVLGIDDVARPGERSAWTSAAFADLCRKRAAVPPTGSWVARNGMVIEQAQILTTHNLATLAGPVGVIPDGGWTAAAHRAFEHMGRLARRLERVPRPLPVIKDLAYAWRHVVFYASLLDDTEQRELRGWLRESAAQAGGSVLRTLEPVLAGLEDVMDGEYFGPDGISTRGQRLLGWSATGHWLRRTFGSQPRLAYKSTDTK